MKNPNEKLKREELKLLSQKAKAIKEERQLSTLNQALITGIYQDEKHQDFNSYRGWTELGYQVKRGAKAFLVWGKPEEVNSDVEGEVYTRFPLRFLFSNAQVFKKGRALA